LIRFIQNWSHVRTSPIKNHGAAAARLYATPKNHRDTACTQRRGYSATPSPLLVHDLHLD
jgi:hypothetical protein